MNKIGLFVVLTGFLLFSTSLKGLSRDKEKCWLHIKDSLEVIRLNQESAMDFAHLAMTCVQKEFPNKPSHVINNEDDVLSPKTMHPAFYGCYDWHSSVHGHWLLVRLLKQFPDMPMANEIRDAININLTSENILNEIAYFNQENRKSFERTYGWAWLLKLTEELYDWDDPDGKKWSGNLGPLAKEIAQRYISFLPKQTYPIRTGVHPNTAFGIGFALDYARKAGEEELENLLTERSLDYYAADHNYPVTWEPNGSDFLSPCLVEADLMRRIMKPRKFQKWFNNFAPAIIEEEADNLLKPAIVGDRTDPQIVHLDGLNFSRAWCMAGIINHLPANDPVREILMVSAYIHAKDALENVTSGSYEGEHWLASFAVYMLSSLENLD